MYIYTNKTEIIPLEKKLPTEGYEVVTTFAELNGKNWLLYNKKQAEFYEANPTATPEEVYKMELAIYDPLAGISRENLIFSLKERINTRVNRNILSGFRWKDYPVWLSSENQVNYKAAYDLAFQAKVMQMNFTEVKFKFGTDEEPVYHIFTSFEEFADFYVSAVNYIQACYQSGWTEKDELEKLSDNELRTLYSEEV